MTLMERIERGKQQKPPRILIYGSEGIGKSSFGASAPNPIFVPTEDGLDQIDCDAFPLCRTFEEVMRCLASLATEAHDYQTVVIDSLDWLERIIWDAVCKAFGASSIEKVDNGFGKGYIHALAKWREVIEALRYLRESHGMTVILIAHAKIEKFQDPESTPCDRFSPRLNKHAAALICEWVDAILFANRSRKEGTRKLYCIGSATRLAKNRFELPEALPLDWRALKRAIVGERSESVSGSEEGFTP